MSQCPNRKVRLSPGHKGLANYCAPCGRDGSNMCELTWGVRRGVCDQGLCQRVQPHSPMGGQIVEAQMGQHPQTQAPNMDLDDEIEVDAWLKVLAESRMQQRASKQAIE